MRIPRSMWIFIMSWRFPSRTRSCGAWASATRCSTRRETHTFPFRRRVATSPCSALLFKISGRLCPIASPLQRGRSSNTTISPASRFSRARVFCGLPTAAKPCGHRRHGRFGRRRCWRPICARKPERLRGPTAFRSSSKPWATPRFALRTCSRMSSGTGCKPGSDFRWIWRPITTSTRTSERMSPGRRPSKQPLSRT